MNLWCYLNRLGLNDWIALWGALLSTVLAVIKIMDWWRDRDRLEIDFSSTSDESVGNSIIIRNLYAKPIIITHWELFFAHNRRELRECELIESADFDFHDQTVGANASIVWRFCDAHYFSTSDKVLHGRSIYLKLCIAGRQKVTRKLYPYH
ncbi:hypothetical protein [Rhodoferax ferrireducens]|uniref:hypothetical protein n=1 Tax=Rhodoferax ferrireducens TaxID=192843 RepID=UPI003BB59D33